MKLGPRWEIQQWLSIMYLRFVLPLFERAYGGEAGFFHNASEVCCFRSNTQDWLKKELREQLDWFNENLPVPKRIHICFKRRRDINGLCWFDPSAKDCIERARYCAWLMTEAGFPVGEICSRDPGRVIWRDDYQIVATASKSLPKAFRCRH